MLKKSSFSGSKAVTSTTDYELVLSADCIYENPAEVALAVLNMAAEGGPSVQFLTCIQIVPNGEWVEIHDYLVANGTVSVSTPDIQPKGSFYGKICESPIERIAVYARLKSAGSAVVTVNARLIINDR